VRGLDARLAFLWAFPLSLALARALSAAAGGPEALAAWSPLRCPLRAFGGWLCPTCGLTRSLLKSWNFEFSGAWASHFLGPVIFFAAFGLWILVVVLAPERRARGRRAFARATEHALRSPAWRKLLWGLVVVYVAWGFSRNFG